MATFTKVNQFVEDCAHGVHNLASDQIVVALTNTDPTAGAAVLANITEVAYTNASSRNVTTTSSAQTAGTYQLTLTDLTINATGGPVGPFRYAVIFNDTPTAPADPILGYYDYGSSITLADGESFTVDFNDANGLLQLN